MTYHYQLDEEEQEILDAFEAGKLMLVENQEEEIAKAREAAKNSIAQREFVNIPMTRGDLYISNGKRCLF